MFKYKLSGNLDIHLGGLVKFFQINIFLNKPTNSVSSAKNSFLIQVLFSLHRHLNFLSVQLPESLHNGIMFK